MNRREAIAALTALPATTRLSVARLRPDDVLVFECEAPMTPEVVARIEAAAARVWPTHRIIVLDCGLQLKIVEGTR